MSLNLGKIYFFSNFAPYRWSLVNDHCLIFEVLVTFLSFPGCASLWCNFSFRPPTGRPMALRYQSWSNRSAHDT